MTSPSIPTQRVALASQAMGGGKPSTALTLANSDLSDSEVAAVGGFINGMGTSLVARMARATGTPVLFTDAEKSQLAALGEDYDDLSPINEDEPRDFWERAWDLAGKALSNTAEAAMDALDPVFTVFDKALDAVKLPARMLSSGLDRSNDDEINDAMAAQGYDPDSAGDYVAFMYNQGDSLYHDLDGIREVYGDDTVDLALDFFTDPEAFNKRRMSDPAFDQKVAEIMARPDWEKAADLVDRQHISPGRDVARILLAGNVDNPAFTALSGALDAVYTLALDPTLVLGKGVRLARAADAATGALNVAGMTRFGLSRHLATGIDKAFGGYYRGGLQNAHDEDGLRALFALGEDGKTPRTQIGRHVQTFLDRAAELRALEPTTDAAVQLHARMLREHGPLMPLLGEINGGAHGRALRPLSDGETVDSMLTDAVGGRWAARTGAEPIENLEDFTEFVVSTAGLLRLGGGFAAATHVVMPGRIALRKRAQSLLRDKLPVFDHTKLGRDSIPIREEGELLDRLDELTPEQRNGETIRRLLTTGTVDIDAGKRLAGQGTAITNGPLAAIRKARAKHDRRARRIATLLPTVSALDLHSGAHAEQVRRFARLYLSRGEADRLATLWTMGTANERRAIARGMLDQTYHASGLSASEQGQAFWKRYRADQEKLDRQSYGFEDTDLIETNRGKVHAALYPSQLSDKVLLPSFRELQYIASKYNAASWFSRNIGARFYSENTDSALTAIKMGWITSPAGGLRNALDEFAGLAARGETPQILKFRALFSHANREHKARRRGVSKEYAADVKQYGEERAGEIWAARLKDGTPEEQARARMLEHRLRHRISRGFRGAADKVDDVLLAEVATRFLSAVGKIDTEDLSYLRELQDLQQQRLTSHVIADTFYADDLAGVTDVEGAKEMMRSGLTPQAFRYRKTGYEKVEVDGGAGADAWASNLGMRFGDPHSPAHVALQWLWEADAETAIAKVTEYMDDPRIRFFRDTAEITDLKRDPNAIEDYARRVVADVKLAVTGKGRPEFDQELVDEVRDWVSRTSKRRPKGDEPYRFTGHITDNMIKRYLKQERGVELPPGEYGNGKINGELAEMLLAGEVPSRDFLAGLPDEYKPRFAIKEQFAPTLPTGDVGRLMGNWTEVLAKAYKKVVTDQAQALVRNPLFSAKYVAARKNIRPYEDQLLAAGWDADSAQAVASRISLAHAEQEVLKHIDNPTVATQFSVLARSFWAFERAQEDWLRRWGRVLRDDPTVVRKGQLAIHGGEAAGVLHRDEDDNLVFTYPGSGLIIGAVNKIVNALPGVDSQVNIPVVPDLSSRLTFVNPSLDNPIGFSATPVLSIPFKFIASTFGADSPVLVSAMDRVINGELGAGREWYEQMLPTFANRIINGALRTDPNSQYGQAWMQSVAQMEAAGQLDDLTGADPGRLNEFYETLSAQIKNNMVARALFGLWAPASPSLPENGVAGSDALDADWSFHQQGLESLKAEARVVLNSMSYPDAMEWWTRNHPGELIFVNGSTTKLTDQSDGASAPATMAAVNWMEDNLEFLGKYPGVGTYFIPQGTPGTPGGEFDPVAYRAQVEQGIRVKKELREYLEDVIVKRGEAIYYDTKDDYDDAIASAERAGNVAAVESLEAQWAQEKALIEGTNPLFAAKNASYAENETRRQGQLRDLARLMNDPRSLKAVGREQAVGIERLADAYASYTTAREALKGQRGATATRARVRLRQQYDDAVRAVTDELPGLADLARGVFRLPA